jgi:hypothetical protein
MLTFRPGFFLWDRVTAPLFGRFSRKFFLPLEAAGSVALLVALAMMAALAVLVSVCLADRLARGLGQKRDGGLLVIPAILLPRGSGV